MNAIATSRGVVTESHGLTLGLPDLLTPWSDVQEMPYALPERGVTVHSGHMGYTIGLFAGRAKCPGRSVTPWMNGLSPATMDAALAIAVDQDDADVEPGKRGNQRDTLAQ
jgi:hypothetical protein